MSLTSHLFAVVVGVAGATLYQRALQSGALNAFDAGSARGSSGTARSQRASDPADDLMNGAGSTADSVDSPNLAERMIAQGLGQGPLSGNAPDGLREAENLFESDSAGGSQARTPGLPDLMRGA